MSRRMMPRRVIALTALVAIAWALSATESAAQAPRGGRGAAAPATRPALFLKEDWKQTPEGGEHAVMPDSIASADLELTLYGPTGQEILLNGAEGNDSNPIHVWTGMCSTPCGLALRHKDSFADLTGLARIRWNTKMSGFHQIRPIVKLADGTWLVGDYADGSPRDWLVSEFPVADVRWLTLDIERMVTTGNLVAAPDLSRVDEIGFADLMPGSGHGPGGWADVGTIEVYAGAVPRAASSR